MLSNGGRGVLYFTSEELKLFENPPNTNSAEQSMNNLINQQKAKIGMAPIGWHPPRGSLPPTEKEKNDIKLEIERLESEKVRLIEESKSKYETWINLIKELVKKKEHENEEYQKMIEALLGQNNEILKFFTKEEFEERFWKYISDNDGFKLKDKLCICPKCGKVPTVERIDYNTNEDGTKKEYPNGNTINGILVYSKMRLWRNGISGSTKEYFSSGLIKYIRCCKFLYDFKDKILYRKGYPGKEYDSNIHFPPGQMNPPIQYVPCEEYDFKTKKDLYEEMQTMKIRLLKLEKYLNL